MNGWLAVEYGGEKMQAGLQEEYVLGLSNDKG